MSHWHMGLPRAGFPTRIFAIAPGLTNTLIVPLGIIFNLAGTNVRGFTLLCFGFAFAILTCLSPARRASFAINNASDFESSPL